MPKTVEELDLWSQVWKAHPKTKIERLNLDCFSPLERDLIKEKALELEDLKHKFDTDVLFFKAVKSGNRVILQAVLQIEV